LAAVVDLASSRALLLSVVYAIGQTKSTSPRASHSCQGLANSDDAVTGLAMTAHERRVAGAAEFRRNLTVSTVMVTWSALQAAQRSGAWAGRKPVSLKNIDTAMGS
jgi:hypothetical protein